MPKRNSFVSASFAAESIRNKTERWDVSFSQGGTAPLYHPTEVVEKHAMGVGDEKLGGAT